MGASERRKDDGVELRYKRQQLDEVIVKACDVHIEQMDSGHWWVGITCSDGKLLHVNLYTQRNAKIYARAEKD